MSSLQEEHRLLDDEVLRINKAIEESKRKFLLTDEALEDVKVRKLLLNRALLKIKPLPRRPAADTCPGLSQDMKDWACLCLTKWVGISSG